jgi:hypothetical protein
VEDDALDQTGDFLSRGSALWDRGVHVWGFIFPWIARWYRSDVIQQS